MSQPNDSALDKPVDETNKENQMATQHSIGISTGGEAVAMNEKPKAKPAMHGNAPITEPNTYGLGRSKTEHSNRFS